MKIVILIFSLLCFSLTDDQDNASRQTLEKDVKQIIETYEKHVVPYLHKFASSQYPPLEKDNKADSISQALQIKLSISVHNTNFCQFGKRLFEEMIEQEARFKNKSKKELLTHIEFYYKCEFLYLDFTFYEKVRAEIK